MNEYQNLEINEIIDYIKYYYDNLILFQNILISNSFNQFPIIKGKKTLFCKIKNIMSKNLNYVNKIINSIEKELWKIYDIIHNLKNEKIITDCLNSIDKALSNLFAFSYNQFVIYNKLNMEYMSLIDILKNIWRKELL